MEDAVPPSSVELMAAVRGPLVGRERELLVLAHALEDSRSEGRTRVVTVLGAGGVGKTRLVREFTRELPRAQGGAVRVYSSSARRLALSYGVFKRLFRSRLGIVEGLRPEAAQSQVRIEIAKVLDDRKVGDVCYFLGQLLDVSFPASPLTRAVAEDPSQARAIIRALVRSFFESDAARSPLCIFMDDLHTADDDSLELLCHLFEHLSGPILILCAARAELLSRCEGWSGFGADRHEVIELRPLDDQDSARLMTTLLGPCEDGVPEPLVEAGAALAGGVPGLLEQMVRIFHDTGVLEERTGELEQPRWKVNIDRLASARLPLNVQDAIATRIGALSPPDRRVLEHAAAMGSVFWLGGLLALSRMDREAPELWKVAGVQDVSNIQSLLDDLVRRDFILRMPDSTFPDEIEYVFEHNLERERIATLTSGTAVRRYHQTIADWLSQKEHVRSQEEYCAMLAEHWEKAGRKSSAGITYIEAGDVARRNYAPKKADEYYRKGLELLGDSDAGRRINALHNRGDVLVMLGKTDEALACFREMLQLAYRLGLYHKGGAAHDRIGRLFRDTGALAEAAKHLDTALELFETVTDERGIAAGHDDIGKLLWLKGEYDAALEHMKTALELRRKIGDRRSIALSLNNIGLVWMDRGRVQQAVEAFEAALGIRREIGDPLGIAETLTHLGYLAQDQNDWAGSLELFEEAYRAAMEVGERNLLASLLTSIGETRYHLGEVDEAIRVLKNAEELCDEFGDTLHLASAKRGLAKAYLMQGELRRARENIRRAVDLFGQIRSRIHLAVALRTLGEVTGAGAWGEGHEGKAVDYFMRSIAICKEIGNELELARSYRAFSEYVTHSEHYRANEDIQREATTLGEMAESIFRRHRLPQSIAESRRPDAPSSVSTNQAPGGTSGT
ncbi:MAG: tetratricopeptide repeat protein [Polyangiaceae bacterium]|nr:tetratricopeptide repeat protein [Polyangiaceae bacterium]